MPNLLTQSLANVLTAKWPGLPDPAFVPMGDPPTMEELWARRFMIGILLDAYETDPENFPAGDLKDKWDSMLGRSREDMITEGIVILWP